MLRWRRLAVTATVCAGALGGTATGAGAATIPKLDWKDCGDGVECATAKVPLDHGRPNGRQIRLAVARKPAVNPSARIGSVFLNPGGPGHSGVEDVRGFDTGGPLNQRFDLVGFDPRGVGASRPAIDCLSDSQIDRKLVQIPPARTSALPRFLGLAKRFGRGCRRNTPRFLLRQLTTADTARDMDLLRQAVGDEKLTYLGRSYGTEIGAVYASLFPSKVRALALDGGINHAEWANKPLDSALAFAAGNEAALDRFFAFCATTPDACPFAEGDPEGSFEGVLAELEKSPLKGDGSDPRPLNGILASSGALAALYDPETWPLLGAGLADARNGNGALLRALSNGLTGRMPDGSYGNQLEAQLVITANDGKFPRARSAYARHLRRLTAAAPHFASLLMTLDATGRNLAAGFDAYRKPLRYPASSPTLLVVGTTADNATTYDDTQALANQLGNARLLTRDGDGHTGFGNSDCITDAVRAYLIEGTLPAEGTTCARGT